MNAAFLLVTSAMLVGQAGGGADKKPAPAPAVVASSCGQDCDDCNGFGHKLRDRLRGMFSRDCCDACKPTTCHTHHCHAPVAKSCCDNACAKSSCDDGCKRKLWTWEPKCREHKCHEHKHCAPAKCHDECEGGFLSKLRARFQRGDCCDSGCGSGCGTVAPARTGEKIEVTPKKMPVVPGKDKKPEEVRIETQPVPFTVPVNPSVPSVEITPVPAPAPRVDGDRRDPF